MKKWVVKKPDKQISKKLEAECSVTPLCADVLAARGISSPAEAAEQFNAAQPFGSFPFKGYARGGSAYQYRSGKFHLYMRFRRLRLRRHSFYSNAFFIFGVYGS